MVFPESGQLKWQSRPNTGFSQIGRLFASSAGAVVVGAGSHEAAVADVTLVQLGGGDRGSEEGEEGDEGEETHVDGYVVCG